MKEKVNILILLLLFSECLFTENFTLLENEKKYEITEGIYIIKYNEKHLNYDQENMNLYFYKNALDKKTTFFISKKEDNDNEQNYFYIKDKNAFYCLVLSDKYPEVNLSIIITNQDKSLWKIIPHIKKNGVLIYYVQNKFNGEYLKLENYNKDNIDGVSFYLTKKISIQNEFKFIKLYTENKIKDSHKLLDSEPVDVLIKYIDLSDPKLNRKNIKQIEKDEDNNELKYSLRSILKNIPWIRKIFILMPNEKVFFLKSQEEIKDKIIYVKDHELIGFNSSSSSVFLFNLHKMKKFGLSENFIYMDDDYFIGRPLNKSQFFYEDNGKIFPLLLTEIFQEMNKTKLEMQHKQLYKKVGKYSQTPIDFGFRRISTLLFLYKIFGIDEKRGGNPLIEAEFYHNAIPLKISDIEEINEYIQKYYEYSKETLESKYRHIRSLQAQTLFMCYSRNKYDRWAKKMWSNFYTLDNVGEISSRWIPNLFVINTSDKKYNYNRYKLEILKLILIFPNKTKYELEDENEKEIINFIKEGKDNITFLIEHLKIKKKKSKYYNYKLYIYIFFIAVIIFILFVSIRRKYNLKLYSKFTDITASTTN